MVERTTASRPISAASKQPHFTQATAVYPHHLIPCYVFLFCPTVPASLSTYLACQTFNPDLIISAGTAGGFKARVRTQFGGACSADSF